MFSTIRIINVLKKYKPDIIQLHSIHNSYINIPMLFNYIKKYSIKVAWTLHDCWSFTGHCPHFEYEGCEKWKTGCHNCMKYREYPKSFFDNSNKMYKLKKKWFTGVENMIIITPSYWLKNLVKQSFLNGYTVKVIHNGIDLSVFSPVESDFKTQYGCENKSIILGVAFGWDEKKGLDIFIDLANSLDNKKYQIVLVGTDDEVDKKLPPNIISIHRTQDQRELVRIYSVADVFLNPTREDTFPTVNLEALACGVPVVTFNTGGSPEGVQKDCGAVVEKEDIHSIRKIINNLLKNAQDSKVDYLKKSEIFAEEKQYKKIIDLYEKINCKR